MHRVVVLLFVRDFPHDDFKSTRQRSAAAAPGRSTGYRPQRVRPHGGHHLVATATSTLVEQRAQCDDDASAQHALEGDDNECVERRVLH